jgi:hypothetical protein
MGKFLRSNLSACQTIFNKQEIINQSMKSKHIILGILSLILVSGCQKDNSLDNIYHDGAKLKRVLLYSSIDSEDPISIVAEYEYNSEDKISKVSSPMYQDGEIVGTIKYDLYYYNSQGQLIKIENFNANTYSPTGFINLKNYIYTYSDNGKKEKELIEYPQIGSFEYSLYKYDRHKLTRIEKYDNADILVSYVINDYDNSGNLIKETSYGADNKSYSYTQHTYNNGLNVQSDVFTGEDMKEHLRVIFRTYDKNGNLLIQESNELALYSSMMSHVLKYEYYGE